MRLIAVVAVLFGGHASAVHGVRIENIDFTPHVLTVRRGDTVRWTWRDGDTPHNVTSRGAKKFKSSRTKMSGTYSVRFTRSGTYRYVCTIHLGMVGRVVVR